MNKRAISIKGEKRHPYSHAIFILKEKEMPILDFVAEAERIINFKKSTKAQVLEENGIKKVVIRDTSTSRFLLYLFLCLSSIGLILSMIFMVVVN
ncbi:MAG: hypothetical protein FWF57_08155 [Defluviitaleaceae bacterium]|nr:hypothetical protein [Defluviitaleaceae bacterium]